MDSADFAENLGLFHAISAERFPLGGVAKAFAQEIEIDPSLFSHALTQRLHYRNML
jgi:hypothetical protein